MSSGKQQKVTERFLAYIPASLMEQLRKEAEKHYRSVSGELTWIIDQYFTHQEERKE